MPHSSMDIQWHLTSQAGMDYILPQTMIFLGREECDVTLQSRSVDKRHAVITYDHYEKRFKVKDLNSTNGTYVNDVRIPGQTYMKLEHMDSIRFGYDPNEFKIQCNRLKQENGNATAVSPITSKQFSPEKNNKKNMEGKEKSQDQTRHNDSGLPKLHANHVASACSIETSSDSFKNCLSPQSSSEYFTTEVSSNESLLYSDDNTNQSYNQKIQGTTLSHLSHLPAESVQQVHPSIMGLKHSSCASSASVPLPPSSSVDSTSAATALASSLDTVNHVSFLPSAKHLLESTSSNTSLQSAFSGDSLDQLNDTSTGAAGTDSVQPESSTVNDLRGNEKPSDDSFLSGSSNVITNSQEGKTEKNQLVCKTNENSETIQNVVSSLQHGAAVSCDNNINNNKDTCITDDLKGKQKSSATAFTIDFDNVKLPSKKLDIKDSISKFAPPKIENERHGHRRNLSLSKVEEHKIPAGDERYIYADTSPEKVNEKCLYSLHKGGNNLKRGYHSEGYFSSDQDDELSAKSERFGLKAKVMEKEKTNLRCQSKDGSSVNQSAAFLIDKMLSDSEKEKKESKMLYKDFQEDIKKFNAAVQELNNNKDDNSKNLKESITRPCKLNVKSSILEDLDFHPFSVQSELPKESLLNQASDDIRDNVSESGTYTIEKESPNLELEEARRNIDRVFGITLEEVEEPVITGPQILPLNIRESQHSPDSDSSKSKSDSTYKDNMNEWAYNDNRNVCSSPSSEQDLSSRSDKSTKIKNRSVLEGNCELSHPSSVPNSSRFMKVISPENARPRRRLPTPPVDKLPFAIAFPRTSGSLDSENDSYSNLNDLTTHNIPNQRLNEISYDTQKLLKETETVVTAMEARMDQRKAIITPLGSSLESRDSGGESDVDTSAASYCNDKKDHKQDRNISKRLSSQLKNKLKLLEESRQSPTKLLNKRVPCNSPSGKLTLRSKSMSMSQDHVGSDNISECETASVASDISSSSDISGSSPRTRRKSSEKSPPAMKFNRAFSLRRARLGYSSDNTNEKIVQTSHTPSSSSHRSKPKVTESKKLESHKSHASASSPSVALSRNDGGRFSLRAGKNAKTSGSSKAEEQGKKHKTSGNSSRSNSTLSAKEMEMKNWRRRKEYDPMKAAAEGKKKEAAKKAAQDKQPQSVTSAPVPATFQRSASFHGTEGLRRSRRNTYTSEDDMTRSLEEEQINNYNSHFKNNTAEPTMSTEKYLPLTQQIGIKETYNNEDYSYDEMKTQNHSDAWMSPPVIRSSQVNSHRHKAKIEALDSLVITTIHQMSSKLCGHTEVLVKKLRSRCKASVGKSRSIEDLLELLSAPDTPTSPTTRSISRELAGTLKNLKKLEKCLQGIEKMVCVDVPTDFSFPSSEQGHSTLLVNERC